MSEIEQQKKDRMGNLSKLKEKLRSCGDHFETINNELFQIKSDIDKKQGDARSLKEEITHLANQIGNTPNHIFYIVEYNKNCWDQSRFVRTFVKIALILANEESSLQALQRESGNTLMIYDRNMPKVIEMIRQQKNSFQHEPKGPLGILLFTDEDPES